MAHALRLHDAERPAVASANGFKCLDQSPASKIPLDFMLVPVVGFAAISVFVFLKWSVKERAFAARRDYHGNGPKIASGTEITR